MAVTSGSNGIVEGKGNDSQSFNMETAIGCGGYCLTFGTTEDDVDLADGDAADTYVMGIADVGTISIHTGLAIADKRISVSPLVKGSIAYLVLADANLEIALYDGISLTDDASNAGTVDKVVGGYTTIAYALETAAAGAGDAITVANRKTIKVRLA